jgi:transposase
MSRGDWNGTGPFWMAALHRPKGGQAVGLTRKGKGTKWMLVTDGNGLPLAVLLESAQKAEITLAEETLGLVWVPKRGPGHPKTKPKELVADRGYDSQAFRMYLRRRGIHPCIPERRGKEPRPGRKPDISSYRLRWIVERTLAWLGNFRRLVVRYERHLSVYQGFFNLACISILLNKLLQ